MNKIDAFKKSVKQSKKKILKEAIKASNTGLDYVKKSEAFENMTTEMIVAAVVQIKYAELYDSLDKSELMEALTKKNIQFEDFNREVERFRTTGYVAIDKYIDTLIKNNERKLSSRNKWSNLAVYIEESKRLINTLKPMNTEELISYRQEKVTHTDSQINEIIQTVYDNRVMPFITSENIKAKDVVGYGKAWIDEDAKLENRHR